MCYNEIMLTKTKVMVSSVSILALSLLLPSQLQTNKASAVEQNTQFQVNVKESLVVSITTPADWATGDVDQFLRNKINVTVNTNNADGFTASMTTKTTSTDLAHTAGKGTIPTLASSSTRSAFPANRWGYSLNDTDAGSGSSTYNALVNVNATPITLISRAESQSTNSRDVYFGAKADTSTPSGTYVSTVFINVVTGVIDDNTNPVVPDNPAQPDPTNNNANYNSNTGGTANGSTTYTYRRTSGSGSSATSTTTTEVSDGDNRNAYIGYTPPQGVVNRQTTTESVTEGSSLATGLAITSAVAATSGTLFFILAKRKKDEDDDEEEEQL